MIVIFKIIEIFNLIIKKILISDKCKSYNLIKNVCKKWKLNLNELDILDFVNDQLKIIKINCNNFQECNISSAISKNGKVWIWGSLPFNLNNIMGNYIDNKIAIPYSIDLTKFDINEDINDVILNKNCIILKNNKKIFSIPKLSQFNFDNENIVDVKSKYKHILYLTDKGNIYTYGSNKYGQLGKNTNYHYFPKKFTSINLIKVDSIEVTNNSSFILTNNGDVYSFGSNLKGELGVGFEIVEHFTVNPIKINIKNIKKLYTGKFNVFAIDNENKLYGWGKNRFNLFGLPINDPLYKTPIIYFPYNLNTKFNNILKIVSSDRHSIFLVKNSNNKNHIYTTGLGYYGELGHNDPKDSNLKIIYDLKKKNIVDICAGFNCSMALTECGAIYVFGNNDSFQLGNYRGIDKNIDETFSNCSNTYLPSIIPYLKNLNFKINS